MNSITQSVAQEHGQTTPKIALFLFPYQSTKIWTTICKTECLGKIKTFPDEDMSGKNTVGQTCKVATENW